jgi:hypothetical protein
LVLNDQDSQDSRKQIRGQPCIKAHENAHQNLNERGRSTN